MYTPHSLSHGQLLNAIEASQQDIDNKTTALAQQRAVRDNLILTALEAKTPYRTLMRLTGLSRNAIVDIGNRPRRVVTMPKSAQ